jgi:hypothetical protein
MTESTDRAIAERVVIPARAEFRIASVNSRYVLPVTWDDGVLPTRTARAQIWPDRAQKVAS